MDNQPATEKVPAIRLALITLVAATLAAYFSYLLVNHNGDAKYIIQSGRIPGLITVGTTALFLSCAFVLSLIVVKFPRFPILAPVTVTNLVILTGAFGAYIINRNATASLSINDIERPVFARLGAEMLSTAYAAALLPAVCMAVLGLIIVTLAVLRIYSISRRFDLKQDTQRYLKVIGVATVVWLLLRFVVAGTIGIVAVLPVALIGVHLIILGMLAFDGVASTDPNYDVAKRSLTIAVAIFTVVLISTEVAVRSDEIRTLLIAASGTLAGSKEGNVDLSVLTSTFIQSAAKVHNTTYLPFWVMLVFCVAITLILRFSGKTGRGKLLTVGGFVIIPPVLMTTGLHWLLSETLVTTLTQIRDPFASARLPEIAEAGTASLCKTQPMFIISSEELKRFDGQSFQGSTLDSLKGCKRALDFGDNFELADRVGSNSRGYSPSFAVTTGLTFGRTKCLIAAMIDKKNHLRSGMGGSSEEYWRHPEFAFRVSMGPRVKTIADPFDALGQTGACLNLAVPLTKELLGAEGYYQNNRPKPEEIAQVNLTVSSWLLTQKDGKVLSIVGDLKARAKQLSCALSSITELRLTINDDVPIDHLTTVVSLTVAVPNGRAVLEL